MKNFSYYIFLLISIFAFYSCADDDDFSSDQSLSLSFSSDKINFDTLFTNIGSATKRFKIYNQNNKSLLIETIELMNPEESGFRMNIDGEKGTKLTNIEILKKDSLFGFVEITVNSYNTKGSLSIRDSIRFITNGNVQYIQLEAIGQDVFIWRKKIIAKDTVVTSLKPILIYDTLVIKENAKLTIEKGSLLYLNKDAAISVHGTIVAQGSIEDPIVFRGNRFDNIEGKIPYDNVPGQWGGIYFHSNSYNNQLENLYVRNAVRGMTFYRSNPQIKKAIVKNTIVHNSSDYGILATNSNIVAENCLFSNSKGATLILEGGKYSFTHCTIANYYSWGSRQLPSLILSNHSLSGNDAPLLMCDFSNSIIYGTLLNEISISKQGLASLKFRFNNCLIKGNSQEGDSFSDNIWSIDPLFNNLNNDRTHSFSFELKENSPAIDKGNRSYSSSTPYDIKGQPRLLDSNPDIGCYEWSK